MSSSKLSSLGGLLLLLLDPFLATRRITRIAIPTTIISIASPTHERWTDEASLGSTFYDSLVSGQGADKQQLTAVSAGN